MATRPASAPFLGHAAAGSAVEAVPAKPEDEHAQGAEGDAVAGDHVGLAVLIELADAGADQDGADKGHLATDHVNDA